MTRLRGSRSRRQSVGTPYRRWAGGIALSLVTLLTGILAVWWFFYREPPVRVEWILDAYENAGNTGELTIHYPLDQSVFPPEIVAPTFRWNDSQPDSDLWLLVIDFSDGSEPMSFVCLSPEWTPADDDWEAIKQHSREKPARATVLGSNRRNQRQVLSAASIAFSTSADEVGAPIFYREVALPFREAVFNTAKNIRWRFGPISSKGQPPVVLEQLPVCGNCHSFSADGKVLAMEVDSGNDKASYTVVSVEKEMAIQRGNLITWSDYKRDDRQRTFGLLCQVSPDGRYLVGTVKDRALAVYREDLTFSQLFFIIKGHLAIYNREKREYHALPGADDPQFVQTNGVWSPDGKEIVFARSRDPAIDPPELRNIKTVLVPKEAGDQFVSQGKTFLYDLYRVPFNDGKGGRAVPVAGASNNGFSNYFPKYSPDGKWIVFCRAKSFMLLQPDSELYIIPAAGGEARRLRCNLWRMNSWHSWSPNGKWLVFSSKANSPYTQLFLTHIDESGESTPAVLVPQFLAPDRAANIPEFVNAAPDAIARIREQFIDEQACLDIGGSEAFYGQYDRAIHWFQKALAMNPRSAAAYENWGVALACQNKLHDAQAKLMESLALEPNRGEAHLQLARVLNDLKQFPEALKHSREAVRLVPTDARPRFYLGKILVDSRMFREAQEHLAEAVRLDPSDAQMHAYLGTAELQSGEDERAATSLRRAIQLDPKCLQAVLALASLLSKEKNRRLGAPQEASELAAKARDLVPENDVAGQLMLSTVCEATGRAADALAAAYKALRLAQQDGNSQLIQVVRERLARLEGQGR